MEKSKKVMVFGTFDGVHEGHRFFLQEAKKIGDLLFVVVSPDEQVETLKKHKPQFPLSKRISDLQAEKIAEKVIPGDETLGTWNVILENMPDVIAIGYDQNGLEKALIEAQKKFPFQTEFKKIGSFKPEIFKSGLLNR